MASLLQVARSQDCISTRLNIRSLKKNTSHVDFVEVFNILFFTKTKAGGKKSLAYCSHVFIFFCADGFNVFIFLYGCVGGLVIKKTVADHNERQPHSLVLVG